MRIALLVVLAFAGVWFVALRPKPAADGAVPPAPAAQQPKDGLMGAPKKAEQAVARANATSAKKESAAAKAGDAPAARPAPKPAPAPAPARPAANGPRIAAGQSATPGPGTATKRVESVKVKRVLADLEAKKVVVLLFWDRRTADDREVYRAVESSARHGGKVSVRAAPIQRLGDYAQVTKDLPIASSPSVVVVDEHKRATVIAGLTVKAEIDAVVKRALARK
jgi:hypothetical protein